MQDSSCFIVSSEFPKQRKVKSEKNSIKAAVLSQKKALKVKTPGQKAEPLENEMGTWLEGKYIQETWVFVKMNVDADANLLMKKSLNPKSSEKLWKGLVKASISEKLRDVITWIKDPALFVNIHWFHSNNL